MYQKMRSEVFVAVVLLSFLPLELGAQAVVENYTSVTDDRLINPEEHNWLSYRGTLDGWGYSKLDQINDTNIDELQPVWSFSTGVLGGHESPPIVNDGVMFVTTPGNFLYAIEAATGAVSYTHLTLPTIYSV